MRTHKRVTRVHKRHSAWQARFQAAQRRKLIRHTPPRRKGRRR